MCLVLVITLIIDSSNVTPKYWGFLIQYMASLLAFYVFDIYLLVGIEKRSLKNTLRLKSLKKVTMPVAFLLLGLCMLLAYDAMDFYSDAVNERFFVIEIVALLIYAYIGILSLLGLAVICILTIAVLTCQVDLCVLCRRKRSRRRHDRRNRNG